MKARIYIHIGLNKTGSTSIQATCYRNRELLHRYGINYLGISENHSTTVYPLVIDNLPIARWVRLAAGVTNPEQAAARNAAVDQALRRELQSNTCGRFVISGEELSRLTRAEIQRLTAKLEPFAESFRIVVYVRDPFSSINSQFQGRLRAGFTTDALIANPPLPNYRRIDSFIGVFGRANVDIRIFQADRLIGGDLIADFLGAIGAAPELANELDVVRANEAWSHEAALLLAVINARLPYLRGWLSGALANLPGQRFRCPRAALRAAEPSLREDLDWLHRTLGEEIFTKSPEPDDILPNWRATVLATLGILTARAAKLVGKRRRRPVAADAGAE